MSRLTIVTPPDILLTNNISFLLIYPSNQIKEQFQTLVESFECDFTVYLYEPPEQDEDPDWLLNNCHVANFVVFDIDNASSIVRDLASYIIANTNTFWLTNSGDHVYNKLSVNRIYNLDYLKERIGETLEKK